MKQSMFDVSKMLNGLSVFDKAADTSSYLLKERFDKQLKNISNSFLDTSISSLEAFAKSSEGIGENFDQTFISINESGIVYCSELAEEVGAILPTLDASFQASTGFIDELIQNTTTDAKDHFKNTFSAIDEIAQLSTLNMNDSLFMFLDNTGLGLLKIPAIAQSSFEILSINATSSFQETISQLLSLLLVLNGSIAASCLVIQETFLTTFLFIQAGFAGSILFILELLQNGLKEINDSFIKLSEGLSLTFKDSTISIQQNLTNIETQTVESADNEITALEKVATKLSIVVALYDLGEAVVKIAIALKKAFTAASAAETAANTANSASQTISIATTSGLGIAATGAAAGMLALGAALLMVCLGITAIIRAYTLLLQVKANINNGSNSKSSSGGSVFVEDNKKIKGLIC